jgi:CMP-N,N'-diacetyllegionaminic acid synthase
VNVVGLIPARGGSKSIPRKNLATLAGRPLITYTFDAAGQSRRLSRTIVSTDDSQIADIARAYGIEAPFVRPAALATDEAPIIHVIQHSVEWLKDNEGYLPEIVVLLQPTSPGRTHTHIDEAVDLLVESAADTVVSVVEVPHQYIPQSVMRIVDGRLINFASDSAVYRRQDKPRFYARNGPAILVNRLGVVASGRLYGDTTRPYVMAHADSIDVDTPDDLLVAEFWLSRKNRA